MKKSTCVNLRNRNHLIILRNNPGCFKCIWENTERIEVTNELWLILVFTAVTKEILFHYFLAGLTMESASNLILLWINGGASNDAIIMTWAIQDIILWGTSLVLYEFLEEFGPGLGFASSQVAVREDVVWFPCDVQVNSVWFVFGSKFLKLWV